MASRRHGLGPYSTALVACMSCQSTSPEQPRPEAGNNASVSAGAGAPGSPMTSAAGAETPRTPRGEASASPQGLTTDSSARGDAEASGAPRGDGAPTVTGSRALLVDGRPYLMRGVCWNPVALGNRHPEGLDFAAFAETDIGLMMELGLNTVRTYEPLLDRDVLDQLWAHGLRVINTVYPWGGASPDVVVERVSAVQDHPAILMWALGNEWNYNGLYNGLSHRESLELINQAAQLVRAEDSTHPITTIYGELPSNETLEAMPLIDVWGINSYRGLAFGDLFDDWAQRSERPMFIAEYGADAYDARSQEYAPDEQSLAVTSLTAEILDHAVATQPGGVVIGGTLFELADEWWKDEGGSPEQHDVGGIAPGGGPYPDQTFNEEWWGLVELDRTPRPAYFALQRLLQQRAAGQ